jgi:hypothetical protein
MRETDFAKLKKIHSGKRARRRNVRIAPKGSETDIRLKKRAMSALGQKRTLDWRPLIRFTPESGHCQATVGCPLRAKSCREQVQQKSAIKRQVLSLTGRCAYWGTLANACRPRSVMMYNERCSLCGSSVTYCSSTKRASPARDSDELTVRPRSPAARNAFRNQISSLVKSKPTLAPPPTQTGGDIDYPASIMPFSSLASFTDRSACASRRILPGRSRRGQDITRISRR